jgi:hypothetical protein
MKNQAPYITEEHVVAWLDGELQADGEIRQALKQDSDLEQSAKEYSALSKAFAHSRTDNRFILPAATDSRVYAALKKELSRNRKAIRTPERAPNAAPIPNSISTGERMRKLWVRRSSYALALALLLGIVWISFDKPSEAPTTASKIEVSPTPQEPTANISGSEPAETVPSEQPTPTPMAAPVSKPQAPAEKLRSLAMSETAPVAEVQKQEAPKPAVSEEPDPAAVMISHRYAKLIKATPTVVVTEQDKMGRM